ncbi:transporter substrate-binding domain-containing protein [Promicromonospora thailandica]|uniref:Polar amino acid transport system substrate-binding protein n=1 Tax=Promicromonospora thailandica TaxID=765201 RepID=A0A9X2JY20_9MICO|nr:transporter substrate-binding domain-containing protein [Promicromonospora thailandica]MCP2264649.1 polar amino acid transport system substrate-binding protein [Promicromonospora thailandica]BFF20273.1 transporter substrate-binding domain-containing protein [Promicromonospora thailandica]
MSTSSVRPLRRAVIAAGSALTLAALAACSSTAPDANGGSGTDKLQELQDDGSITVAFNGEEPYSFEDAGELTGATIALDREIFGELGVEGVEGVQTEWNSLIPGLTAGRYDAVSAGMSILPERCDQALFSEPQIMYTTSFLVPEGNPDNLTDMQSAKDAGVKLAVLSGAIEAGYANDLEIDKIEVGTAQDGLDAVTSGRADALALTAISLKTLEEKTDAPVEVTDSFVAEIDGVPQIGAGAEVFPKGQEALRDAYNEKLAEIVSDEERWLEVVGPFGFTAAERPVEGLTTEKLCEGDLESLATELAPELGLDG